MRWKMNAFKNINNSQSKRELTSQQNVFGLIKRKMSLRKNFISKWGGNVLLKENDICRGYEFCYCQSQNMHS